MKKGAIIVRDRYRNRYKILGIKEGWFKDNGDLNYVSYINPLKHVDLVTSKYNNETQFIDFLYNEGYVDNKDLDIFVVYFGPKSFNITNAIYEENNKNFCGCKLNAFLVRLSQECDYSNSVTSKEETLKLLYAFVQDVYNDDNFKKFISNAYTNIPKRLVDVFKNSSSSKQAIHDIRSNNDWMLSEYDILRNMLDLMIRYKKYSCYDNVIFNNFMDRYINDFNIREQMKDSIKSGIDKSLNCYQTALFGEEDISYLYAKAHAYDNNDNKEILDKNKKKLKLPKFDSKSKNKLDDVCDYIGKLPLDIFLYNKENKLNKFKFNNKIFGYEIDAESKSKLNSLLNNKLLRLINNYLYHIKQYKKTVNEFYIDNDTIELRDLLDYDYHILREYLNDNKKVLDLLYEWCIRFSRCVEISEMVDNISKESYNGDDESSKRYW